MYMLTDAIKLDAGPDGGGNKRPRGYGVTETSSVGVNFQTFHRDKKLIQQSCAVQCQASGMEYFRRGDTL